LQGRASRAERPTEQGRNQPERSGGAPALGGGAQEWVW